jgi:glutathione peroxidase
MAILDFLKPAKKEPKHLPASFYQLSCKTIDGDLFDFSTLKGKKVLIVNVASKCGFTPQYEDLEKLFKEYGGDDFIILGFPSNDFLKQESGSEKEIKAFCQLTYGVSFPMMSKVRVKGDEKHEVYKWLTRKEINGVMNSVVKWNFQKYMISKDGQLVGFAAPSDKPYSEKILDFIKA